VSEGKDFASLTESVGSDFSQLQMQMAWFRYAFANEHIPSGGLLEVGAGTGFGSAAFDSQEYVAAEFDSINLQKLRDLSRSITAVQASGEHLPFADRSFAGVIALEMIYYLENQELFAGEVFRVIQPGGTLVVCLANSARPGFHRSPYSTQYPNVDALRNLLHTAGFSVEIYGGFPFETGVKDRLFKLAARLATRLRLVPDSLEGRAKLKRYFQGSVAKFAGLPLLPESAKVSPRLEKLFDTSSSTNFRVLYSVATKPTLLPSATSLGPNDPKHPL
jgi:SAM-dependent methyltransferase